MTTKACSNMGVSQFELSKITLKNLNKFDLSPTGKLVLLSLIDCYNPRSEEIFPKQSTIADNLGISIKSVQRSIKELADAQVVIYETKSTNRYKLTSTFFDLLKMSHNTPKIVPSKSDNLSPVYHEQIHEEKKNKVLSFQLTEFQKKYADIFQKLSESELKKYKSLQGYEKEDFLKAKRKECLQAQSSKELQLKLTNDRQNTGSPLNFTKEQSIDYLNNLPPFLSDSYFAKELRKKWKI